MGTGEDTIAQAIRDAGSELASAINNLAEEIAHLSSEAHPIHITMEGPLRVES